MDGDQGGARRADSLAKKEPTKLKWFNPTKGYVFIKPGNSGTDVFVHISAVEKAGYTNLAEGARISYEYTSQAINAPTTTSARSQTIRNKIA